MAIEPVASLRTREYDAFRALLREVREAKGVSQEQLSKKIGRQIAFIGKVELGSRRLDVIELMEICVALDYDPEKLVRELKKRTQAARAKQARPQRKESTQ